MFSKAFFVSMPYLLIYRTCSESSSNFRKSSFKIISHSDGHSVVNQNKKPIYRDIKNRREHCSGFKMMKPCIGFEIQIRSVCRLTNHAGRHCGIVWCGNVQLPLSSNRSFILYSVVFYYKSRNICFLMLLRKVFNISPKIGAYY